MRRLWSRPDRLALAGLTAIVLALFHEALLPGRAFFERDLQLLWIEQVESFVRSIARGSWPLWDPLAAFGQPLLANPNTQALYPFTWLHLLALPWTQYKILVLSHLLLSGVGMQRLARRFGLSAPGAFVAAGLWISSGPLVSLVSLWNHLAGAAWIPWTLLAAERALASRRPRDGVLWGATAAAQLLAGSPDMSLLTGLVCLGLVLGHAREAAHERGRVVAVTAIAAAFALALPAAQWLPTLAVLRGTARAALGADLREFWSTPPLRLLEMLYPVPPDAISAPGAERWFHEEAGAGPYLTSLYLGLPGLALVVAAWAARARRRLVLLASVAGFGLLLALGRHAPFYAAAAQALPPLRLVRYPEKAVLATAWAWALLAGLGLDAWRAPEASRRLGLRLAGWTLAAASAAGACLAALALRAGLEAAGRSLALAAGLGILAVAAWAAGLRRGAPSSWPGVALAGLALAAPVVENAGANATASHDILTYRPPVLDVLLRDGASRVYVYDYDLARSRRHLGRDNAYRYERVPAAWPASQVDALSYRVYLFPPLSAAFGLRGSFDFDSVGLLPSQVTELKQRLVASEGTPGHLRLLRVAGVSHVVALHAEGLSDLVPVATVASPFPEAIRVFRVPGTLPRTYVVGRARIAPDAAAGDALMAPDFDPATTVVLPDGAPLDAGGADPGSSRILVDRPDRVRLEVTLAAPGVVVLLDAFDPGWRATLDGQPVPIERANLAFRGVRVGAGRHVLEQSYAPPGLRSGLAVSGLGVAVALALLAASRPRGGTSAEAGGALSGSRR